MRPLQTPPPHPGHAAGSVLATVKVEDGWAQSPPVPASCQLSRQSHSPYSTGDTREVRVPRWGPLTLGKFWVISPYSPMVMSSKAHGEVPASLLAKEPFPCLSSQAVPP